MEKSINNSCLTQGLWKDTRRHIHH